MKMVSQHLTFMEVGGGAVTTGVVMIDTDTNHVEFVDTERLQALNATESDRKRRELEKRGREEETE